jgi:FAD/FMN-containing dehydrogenase
MSATPTQARNVEVPATPQVITDKSARQEYAMLGAETPDGVVKIRDAGMLQETIRWARQRRIPLFAASSSAPHHEACTQIPKGALVLDLSPMKRVLKIDRRNRVALFEPGVTFEDLAPMAAGQELRIMTPLMPRPGKSVLAAYLDREPVIQPRYQWDLSDPLLCIEVIFGTGDLLRTGSAGGPGSLEQQWKAGDFQKGPMGPGQNDWMRLVQGSQGSIGVATWCSAKCEVLPKIQQLHVAGADRLEPLVDASYRMFHGKLTDIHFLVDRDAFANLVATNPGEREQALRDAASWNLVYSVSGIQHFPEERVAYLAKQARREVEAKGARLRSPPLVNEAQLLALLVDPAASRRRAGDAHWRNGARGTHGSVYFQTTMDRAGALIDRFDALARDDGIGADRVSRYLQPQIGGRCCHVELIVAADARDAGDIATVQRFCAQAAVPMIEAGAFFSRPHGAWAEPAMVAAHSSRWIFDEMKNIFDPDRILAPGRLALGGHAHV